MIAPDLGVTNVVAFLDLNDYQSLGRMSEIHPNFYPIAEKVRSFGWQTIEVDGHDTSQIVEAVEGRESDMPLMVIGKTTKGKGVSYMENVPIWHYRSPSPEEYQLALKELEEQA